MSLLWAIGICGVSIVGAGFSSFCTVPPGRIGYKNLFGKINDKQYESGFAFINPLSRMVILDLRKKIAQTESIVSSNEGLEIKVNIDVVYRLKKENAKEIYLSAGAEYEKVLLFPQINSSIRDAISGHNAKALYNDETRIEIKNKIFNDLNRIQTNGIVVEDVLINKIVLPQGLIKSIENKLQAEQEMQKMDFTLAKEKKEAERKEIEATGIKTFQTIVSEGISQELLQWKGITATEELAKSPNSKVVIIGNSTTGLPLIFNSE